MRSGNLRFYELRELAIILRHAGADQTVRIWRLANAETAVRWPLQSHPVLLFIQSFSVNNVYLSFSIDMYISKYFMEKGARESGNNFSIESYINPFFSG